MGGKGQGKGKTGPPPPPKAQTAEEREQAKLEAQHRKEQQMQERRDTQERERADVEARAALKDRLPTMHGHDIFGAIPWSNARMSVQLVGACEVTPAPGIGTRTSPGITVVDLGNDKAVCVRHVNEIVSEFVAEHLAIALQVPVARSRVVRPDEAEFSEIDAAIRRCQPISFENFNKASDMRDPNCPLWARMRDNHPDYYPKMVKMCGRCTSVAVLEFVNGRGLASLGAEEAWLLEDTAIWNGMGRLCALDVLLNNMDRLPLPVFDNREGNISNVLVTSKETVGIDQQVNVIRDALGMKRYLERVQSFVRGIIQTSTSGQRGDASSESNESASTDVIARIKSAGVMMQDSHSSSLLDGLRVGIAEVAEAWNSGTLQVAIDEAELAASRRIVASQSLLEGNVWSTPQIEDSISNEEANACANFLRQVAAAIGDAVGSNAAR